MRMYSTEILSYPSPNLLILTLLLILVQRCGRRLYDDYSECQGGVINEIKELDEYSPRLSKPDAQGENRSTTWRDFYTTVRSAFKLFVQSPSKIPSLPQH